MGQDNQRSRSCVQNSTGSQTWRTETTCYQPPWKRKLSAVCMMTWYIRIIEKSSANPRAMLLAQNVLRCGKLVQKLWSVHPVKDALPEDPTTFGKPVSYQAAWNSSNWLYNPGTSNRRERECSCYDGCVYQVYACSPNKTRKPPQPLESLWMNGFSGTELKVKSLQNFADFMESRRHVPLPTTLKRMHDLLWMTYSSLPRRRP